MANDSTANAAFRAIADSARKIPEALGVRTTTVTIRTRVYSAPVGQHGTTLTSTTDNVLSPVPKVRQRGPGPAGAFGGGWATLSNGDATERVYEIGPTTLSFPGGGYTPAQLAVGASVSQRPTVVLTGDDFAAGGEEFVIEEVNASRPHQVRLLVRRGRQGA